MIVISVTVMAESFQRSTIPPERPSTGASIKALKLKSEQRFLWSVMWVDKYNCSGPVVVKHVVEVT